MKPSKPYHITKTKEPKTCLGCGKEYKGIVGPGDSHFGRCDTCKHGTKSIWDQEYEVRNG